MTQTPGDVMQTTTKLKALYALHPPLRVDSESASTHYRKFFKDLGPKRTIPIRGSFTHNGELLAVTVRSGTASQKKRHFSKSPFLEIGDALLEFSATFEFPGQERFFAADHAGARIARTREQSIADWRSYLSHDLELTIQSFFCALAIAYEGAVRPTQNVWIQDGSEYGTDRSYFSVIHESIEFLREKNAFPRIEIKLDTVINWTFAQNGIFDGYAPCGACTQRRHFWMWHNLAMANANHTPARVAAASSTQGSRSVRKPRLIP